MAFINKIRGLLKLSKRQRNGSPQSDESIRTNEIVCDGTGESSDGECAIDTSKNGPHSLNEVHQSPIPFYNYIDIYTDGSSNPFNGRTGSSFTLFNKTTKHIVYKLYRLDNHATSCVTEFSAIYQALYFLIENIGDLSMSLITIYTDFKSASFCLSDGCNLKVNGKKMKINLNVFRNMIEILKSRQNFVEVKWVKRDTAVLNKFADRFARMGSKMKRINFDTSVILLNSC